MHSRRILIAGLSSAWGGRLAQRLERERGVEAVVGIDSTDPRHELHRTEFVRLDGQPALLRRIIEAARIDTVVDTRLLCDPFDGPLDDVRETDVLGTASLLSACSGADSPVRTLVVKSSAIVYGSESTDPFFFTEEMARSASPRTGYERGVLAAEEGVAEFRARRPDVCVTVLRFAAVLGDEGGASHQALLELPVVPGILGYDPRLQFIHEDDVVGALEHAVRHPIPGVYNAAADGVLLLSEIASTLAKPLLPMLPPWGTDRAAAVARRLGLRVPVETVRELRFGRGLDNRRLKASGFAYRYTTREAVLRLRARQRLRPLLRSGAAPYHYEREVEEFLRRSPSVLRGAADPPARSRPAAGLADLTPGELVDLIPSLGVAGLSALRRLESAGAGRAAVLEAIDRQLQRRGALDGR